MTCCSSGADSHPGLFYVESSGVAAYVQSLGTHQGVLDATEKSG